MGVIVRIETKIEDVLEWEQEFSYEQQEYIEKVIASFEYKLENCLTYSINGFYQISSKFSYNPNYK